MNQLSLGSAGPWQIDDARRTIMRSALMTTIDGASRIALPTASTVQAAAAAIRAVVAFPAEIAQGAQDTALSLLQTVAGQAALLSNATATSVVAALSDLATAVSLDEPNITVTDPATAWFFEASDTGPAHTPPPAPLQQRRRRLLQARQGSFGRPPLDIPMAAASDPAYAWIRSIVSALADSLSQGLAVPGDPPLTVNTSAIQLSVRLASTGAGSPLGAAAVSAPGTVASFGPLTPEALAILAKASPRAVVVQFISTKFDPFAASADDGGVTHLRFVVPAATVGGPLGPEVTISGLATPLPFTVPASTPRAQFGNSTLAPACGFWDKTAQRYR